MRSKDLKPLFGKPNVMSSLGRPRTSNDNAFAESVFATMKGKVIYPEFFGSIEDAEAFTAKFVEWHNYEHLHFVLDLLTPFSVHYRMCSRRFLNGGTDFSKRLLNDTGQGRRSTGLNRRPT